jgi:hypothetical protein
MKKFIGLFFFILLLTGCVPEVEYKLEAGQDTIEVFEEHELKGCAVIIDEIEYQMDYIVKYEVDNQKIGTYIVESAVDVNDKTYTCQRVVFVTDQTKPTLTLLPGVDTIHVGEVWVDAGVNVTDNYDQDVMVVFNYTGLGIEAGGPLVFSSTGLYEVEYTAIDDSENETTIIRFINVIEGE